MASLMMLLEETRLLVITNLQCSMTELMCLIISDIILFMHVQQTSRPFVIIVT